MKSSLARRERLRRNRKGTRRPSGGVGARGAIAIILPLLLLGTSMVLGLSAVVGTAQVYSAYSQDLKDPKVLLESLDLNQQTVLYDRTGTVQLAVFGSENRREIGRASCRERV